MNIANERWETIAEFPNYMISTESRIMNKTTLKMVSISINKRHKHRQVRLWNNGKTRLLKVYRLKALAFIENPENKREVNHKYGDRMDEDLSALEWNTRKENIKHAIANGFCGGQFKKGELKKLTNEDVLLLRRWYQSGFFDRNKIGKVFGVHNDHATKVANGRLMSHV